MPLSSQTSVRSPTARTTDGSIRIELSAPSSCRPPWFDTITASAPASAAICASSASSTPLRISLPFHWSRMRAILAQSSFSSNCSFAQAVRSDSFCTFFTWPTMLRNWRRGVRSIPSDQRGFSAMLIRLGIVGRGGEVRPFLRSLWRWPRICRSSVRTSALQFAARARSMMASTKSSSRMTYSWNQNGSGLCAATSSIEQIDMVDRVKGTPALAAARAA